MKEEQIMCHTILADIQKINLRSKDSQNNITRSKQ